MVKLLKVESPRLSGKDQSVIVVIELLPDEVIPFVVSPDDIEEHGRVLFNGITNREFGPFNVEATYLDAREKYAQLRDYKESGDLHQSNRPF